MFLTSPLTGLIFNLDEMEMEFNTDISGLIGLIGLPGIPFRLIILACTQILHQLDPVPLGDESQYLLR